MLQISEPYISKRSAPVNSIISDDKLFRHEEVCQIDPVFLIEISNLLYNGSGMFIVTKKRKLPEKFLKYNIIKKFSFFAYSYFQIKMELKFNLIRINIPVIFVVDYWSHGYFHWMAEVLPRLVAAKNKIGTHPVVLPAKFKMLPFVSDSLKQIGINFRFLEVDNLYKLREVFFISHFAATGNYNDLIVRETRKLLHIKDIKSVEKRFVYISRKNTNKRNISNEVEIIKVLRSYSFEIVFAEELSFYQQQNLFSSTDILVGNHGAGLTNMLFMKPTSKVLELRCKNDTLNNCYFSLASALQLDYYYLNTEPVNQGENPHTANVIVNAHELNELLQLIITGNN